jgi:small subunit ribosomal protein S1
MSETHDVNELDKKYVDEKSTNEFAEMLEQDSEKQKQIDVSVGQRISGTIQKIDESAAFVDFGGRSEAVIEIMELKNAEGELTHQVGEQIEAYVSSLEGEVRLTLSLKANSQLLIRQAYENKIPVDARVTGFNSGGLVINLGGKRAFCPVSQIDTQHCEDLASYAGQTLTFKIVEFRDGGRNIVLSRRAHLEAEAREKAKDLLDNLKVGVEMTSKVTRIEKFGAFVDLGGIEGMVHVSELSYSRVGHPKDVLSTGDEVQVKILELKGLGGDKERISLSIKALLPDPWFETLEKFREGDVITGTVTSIQQFGAFVQVAPGVEGLVHISQLASTRTSRPADVVSVQQSVQAKILKIDREQKRISLSMKAVTEDAQDTAETKEIEEFKSKSSATQGDAESPMADALRKAGLL